MQEHSRCHHRLNSEENVAFTTEDGIEVYVAGAAFEKCVTCGHVDFPLESKEMIDSSLKEKRSYPNSPRQLYINLMNLL
ncbi:hypothetical protein ACFYKX_02675 [Cytobacillus sp. FJAT-54145]|uniref:YgiT-type zinc finger protein n=1 Tax=Cytobacillus spartinae TaxID=3299023 RepID=A0ABW6K5R0_9BACI